MSRVRLLVLWLMLFAVPLQAFAAAAMVFCGPGAPGAPAVAGSMAHDHAAPHAHGSDAAHADHHHALAHDDGDGDGADPTSHASSSDTLHKCGSCAACHATAIACTPELLAFQGLPRADLSEPPAAVATVAPRLLDKPPRA
ncbi:hypothetical protein [Variovorax sp. TBS-050B]|uniref:hypothetical protein n=1 Tax=Variovorax sp. TBS-050B TaxID=2940551 RepID=UPI002475A3A9|nr:hypothetical protein [Variovorax sp. TBS-050B]